MQFTYKHPQFVITYSPEASQKKYQLIDQYRIQSNYINNIQNILFI